MTLMTERAAMKSLRSGEGFSLLEVMFALTFLGIGLLAVAGMIPLATHQIASAKAVTDGVSAGQEVLEEIRMENYNSGPLEPGNYSRTVGHYSITWTIQEDVPVIGSKRIDMTVSWPTTSGVETTSLSTFVTR
jgi:Tfp pilus assembly protein PilV